MKEQKGYTTVMVIIFLAVLTVLGISMVNISNTDIWISRNQAIWDSDFYIAEGGLRREAQEVGNGRYRPTRFFTPHVVAMQDGSGKEGAKPHAVMGEPYSYRVEYAGKFLPVKGFSAKNFSRYDYTINVVKNRIRVRGRYYTIGPNVRTK